MLNLVNSNGPRFCDRVPRRRVLEVGSLGTLGLGLPGLLSRTTAAQQARSPDGLTTFGRAKRVILLFMWGGPAHQDTWDLKPHGPLATRGEFLPIATGVPGMHISEHFPHIARHADKLAIIRSVAQQDNNHSTGAHAGLTGRRHELKQESFNARASDFPHYGSVLSNLRPNRDGLPTFVALPEMIHTTNGAITPGQGGGLIGRKYDPFRVNEHPDREDFSIASLMLPDGVGPGRLASRRGLLDEFDRAAQLVDRSTAARSLDEFYRQALDLVLAPRAREAFDIGRVPDAERWRYGWHAFGQSVLMARRLIETGVQLVTVYWHRERKTIDSTWDTHSRNFYELKDRLMPTVDRSIAALLEDLDRSGLLDETLVVWNSEFGRTPKVNASGGRDHWGPCNSVVMAGGGVPGGQVFGATDDQAAYPVSERVTQDDIAATIYHLLGLESETRVYDRLARPHAIALGEPIHKLLGNHCRPAADSRPTARLRAEEVGRFETMLRQRSNRHLSIEFGNADSERLWKLVGFDNPRGSGLERFRPLSGSPASITYRGQFYNHFDYTHVVLRLAEPRPAGEVKLVMAGRAIPVPDELAQAEPRRLWQLPIPGGIIRSIATGPDKFVLELTAPDWKLTSFAVVGERIRDRHLEHAGIA